LYESVHLAESHHLPGSPPHIFTVDLDTSKFTLEKYQLYKYYQINVHHETPNSVTEKSFKRFLCDSPLRQVIVDSKTCGSFHECYRIDGVLIAVGVIDLLPHAVSSVYCITSEICSQFSFGKLTACREISMAVEKGYDYYYMGKP
jgi:arginine-tRNA-protein transferase